MGQLLSWIRGPPRDVPALHGVAVEQQSQPSQAAPIPAAQVSASKPAQFEKATSASNMATKPGVVTTATGVTAGGSASAGTRGKVTAETASVPPVKAAATVPSPATGGITKPAAAASTAPNKPKESPKDTASAKSATATATIKADVPKAAATAVSVTGKTEEAKSTQSKVQVEVPRPEAKGTKQAPAVDPFDALAGFLPPSEPLAPEPVYTGPEVTEHGLTSEKGHKCGERDDTLPPGYRYEDMPPAPTDFKPKDVPKPMSTDEALDSLSFGFTSSTAPTAPKKQEKVDTVDNFSGFSPSSAGFSNFAPPPLGPLKKQDTAAASVAVCPAPPADKKAKMEKVTDDFSLMAGLSSAPPKKAEATAVPFVAVCPAPPVDLSLKAGPDTKPNTEKIAVCPTPKPNPIDVKPQAKPTTDEGAFMSLDALGALGDTLAAPKAAPEPPKLRPEDIIVEDKLKDEEDVLVGVHESSIPPEYRFNTDKLQDLPAPEPEPSMGTGEALDLLSGDFMSAPVVRPSAPPPQIAVCPMPIPSPTDVKPAKKPTTVEPVVEDLSALDLLAGDFVAPTKTSAVQAPVPPPAKKTPEIAVCPMPMPSRPDVKLVKKAEDDFMSLDALGALGDTLAAPEPTPEPPKLRPEDIVSEDKLKDEKGVFVGEDESSIPPEYRVNMDKLKDLPAPKPEPSMGTGEALDLLSGDFMSSSAAPVITPSAPPQIAVCPMPIPSPTDVKPVKKPQAKLTTDESSADFALDALAGDFVAATVAPAVKSVASVPTKTSPELAGTDDALDALSDTLMDSTPAPEPAPTPIKDIVEEKKVVEERLIKMGERDDSLPPEYRPTEEDRKAMAEEAKAKAPKTSMGDTAALDLLSSDFSAAPRSAAPAASCTATTQLVPPVLDSEPLKPMAGPVLDSLAGTLLPDRPEFKPKGDKPKGKSKSKSKSKKHHAEDPSALDQLSGQLSSDVVPTSTKKGGKS